MGITHEISRKATTLEDTRRLVMLLMVLLVLVL